MTETTEKTNWVELVQLRAGAAVQILRQQKDDTALNFLRTLARQGFSLTVEGETLKVSPSSKITNKLRETLIKHKKGLVSLLSPWPRPSYPIDWRREWELEWDVLRRRLAATDDPKVTAEIADLLQMEPEGKDDWNLIGALLIQLERRLRNTGTLPPAVSVENGTIQEHGR